MSFHQHFLLLARPIFRKAGSVVMNRFLSALPIQRILTYMEVIGGHTAIVSCWREGENPKTGRGMKE